MSETSTYQTIEHYLRPGIISTITRIAQDGSISKAGNGDFWAWYKPTKHGKRLLNLGVLEDYLYIINRHRVLYWTLNYFHSNVYSLILSDIKDSETAVLGRRQDTRGYTLGIDIDKISDIHNPMEKMAVEALAQFLANKLMKSQPNSVYAAFSGGGIYLYLHHKIWDGYFRKCATAADFDSHVYILTNAFNRWISDSTNEFFKTYPQYIGLAKADALNNSKRVFKTIFSVHKKHNYAVIPLDPHNIKINFNDAALPLRDDVIKQGETWYTGWDNLNNFRKEIQLYEKQVLDNYYERQVPTELSISETAIKDMTGFPPCIKNVINAQVVKEGKTRAIALLATFLGQAGWSVEDAKALFHKKAADFGASTTNIFESCYRRMHTPLCSTIREKTNLGYPNMAMGSLGICKPDARCMAVTSPYYYVDNKANKKRIIRQMQRKAAYFTKEKKEDL